MVINAFKYKNFSSYTQKLLFKSKFLIKLFIFLFSKILNNIIIKIKKENNEELIRFITLFDKFLFIINFTK